ncbi:type II restriction endonuclease [Candidatus Magnetomonas plexicatena]|uniref:type II restriction endonuclease n=1 Tax=Candidatus Magnetomonas plexicatena TaxID=2552947 RepID=UPI00110532F5|nr:restriction endonuclease [Nitrospirales bacterium LBB_01]
MSKLSNSGIKEKFSNSLSVFVERMKEYVSTDNGEWSVKGFIDIYRNIYTISSDTKIVSKILEVHLFPLILQFAEEHKYFIVLAEHQNWYPDLSFVSKDNPDIKFAVDFKTTYRDIGSPGHVNGFTLGSHGTYFKNRTSTKNIQFPYDEYSGHFCLGIIYTRSDVKNIDETQIINVKELDDKHAANLQINQRRVHKVESLRSITSVIKDFQFFVCEKWRLASDRQGSGNTANIGSITFIEDILQGRGIFSKLGEDWFDEYWMNYGLTTMKRKGTTIRITRLEDFIDFKGGDTNLIVPLITKKRIKEEL